MRRGRTKRRGKRKKGEKGKTVKREELQRELGKVEKRDKNRKK